MALDAAADAAATTQDDQWSTPAPTTDGSDFQRNPLLRPPSDPVAAPRKMHLRMRPPTSPASMVEGAIRLLFAPPGYETDPCAPMDRSINQLLNSVDAESGKVLRDELAREKALCR